MIKFYGVDEDYINFLKKYDNQIPNVRYSTVNKFVCGIVLSINGHNYFAPISSNTQKQRTNMLILDKNERPLSSIKFSFMFPVRFDVLTPKDIASIRQNNEKYADLLTAEYYYCKSNENKIIQKAQSVYNIGCNSSHRLNYTCCNFKRLEEIYLTYGHSHEPYKIR